MVSLARCETVPAVPDGGAWYTVTGQNFIPIAFPTLTGVRFSSQAPLMVTLLGVNPGTYKVGLIVDTGASSADPFGLASAYLVMHRAEKPAAPDQSPLKALSDPKLSASPVNPATPTGPQRGYIEATQPLWLAPDAPLVIKYSGPNSTEILAIRITPADRLAPPHP